MELKRLEMGKKKIKIEKPPIGNDTTHLHIWRVPKILKRQFKSVCGKNEVTMRSIILKAMSDYVRSSELE